MIKILQKKRVSKLGIGKVSRGATFAVFQWKRPLDSSNKYQIIFNGRERVLDSTSKLAYDSFYYSDFIEGLNTLKIIAGTLEGEPIVDTLVFKHSFEDISLTLD